MKLPRNYLITLCVQEKKEAEEEAAAEEEEEDQKPLVVSKRYIEAESSLGMLQGAARRGSDETVQCSAEPSIQLRLL